MIYIITLSTTDFFPKDLADFLSIQKCIGPLSLIDCSHDSTFLTYFQNEEFVNKYTTRITASTDKSLQRDGDIFIWIKQLPKYVDNPFFLLSILNGLNRINLAHANNCVGALFFQNTLDIYDDFDFPTISNKAFFADGICLNFNGFRRLLSMYTPSKVFKRGQSLNSALAEWLDEIYIGMYSRAAKTDFYSLDHSRLSHLSDSQLAKMGSLSLPDVVNFELAYIETQCISLLERIKFIAKNLVKLSSPFESFKLSSSLNTLICMLRQNSVFVLGDFKKQKILESFQESALSNYEQTIFFYLLRYGLIKNVIPHSSSNLTYNSVQSDITLSSLLSTSLLSHRYLVAKIKDDFSSYQQMSILLVSSDLSAYWTTPRDTVLDEDGLYVRHPWYCQQVSNG